MKMTGNSEQLKRLNDVLAIYGADPAGWPVKESEALQLLLRSDRSAARVHNEAIALEKVLSHAPAGTPDAALKQRIVDAAIADGAREPRIVPISSARKARRDGLGYGKGSLWPAAAMAASFALGLYLGVAGLGTTTINQAIDMASLGTAAVETDSSEFMLDGNGGDQEGLL